MPPADGGFQETGSWNVTKGGSTEWRDKLVKFVGSPKPEMGHLWRGRQLAVMNKAWLDSDFEL